MHVYIYDDFVNTKKYDSLIAKIETRITDLSLNGKIIRLGVMKNIEDAVENEIKRGAKTIVAVGDNSTVNKIINAMVKTKSTTRLGENIPLGIIPIGEKNNEIATALGISIGEEACNFISARRIEKINVGVAGKNYFIARAIISSKDTTIEISKDYSLEILENGIISVVNMPLNNYDNNYKSDPKDGVLELIIKTKEPRKILNLKKTTYNKSFFSLKKLTIINKNSPLFLDNTIKINGPVEISVLKNKINLIVGKERVF